MMLVSRSFVALHLRICVREPNLEQRYSRRAGYEASRADTRSMANTLARPLSDERQKPERTYLQDHNQPPLLLIH